MTHPDDLGAEINPIENGVQQAYQERHLAHRVAIESHKAAKELS